MNLIILTLLFFAPPVFADSTYQSRTHECQNDKGFKRRVELQYKSPEAPLPCRAVWFREDVKNPEVEHVLVDAKHQVGMCEAREQAYLDKMKRWKVSCEVVNPQTTHKMASEAAPIPEAQPHVEMIEPATSEKPATQDTQNDSPPASWSGPYAGAVLGATFGKGSDKTGDFGYNADGEKWDYDSKGFNGAVEFGFNNDLGGFLLAPEVELGYLGMKGSSPQPSSRASDTVGKMSSDFYTALRARFGIVSAHSTVFAALGVMGVNTKMQIEDSCSVAPCGGTTVDASKKGFSWGYTMGAGYEYIFADRWSLKAEYLYFNLGEQKFTGTTNLGNSYEWKGQASGSILRAGLNYHF